MRQPISPVGRSDHRCAEEGFTLLEVVCVMAIVAILSAILLPALPRGTSRAQLEAYAIDVASLLTTDHNAAVRRRAEVVTRVDAKSRLVASGTTTRMVRVPDDVDVRAVLSARCNRFLAGSAITFFPSGMSCGGTIALTRMGFGYEVRVNWLTGGVQIVPHNPI